VGDLPRRIMKIHGQHFQLMWVREGRRLSPRFTISPKITAVGVCAGSIATLPASSSRDTAADSPEAILEAGTRATVAAGLAQGLNQGQSRTDRHGTVVLVEGQGSGSEGSRTVRASAAIRRWGSNGDLHQSCPRPRPPSGYDETGSEQSESCGFRHWRRIDLVREAEYPPVKSRVERTLNSTVPDEMPR
jgi:hypothetical protein